MADGLRDQAFCDVPFTRARVELGYGLETSALQLAGEQVPEQVVVAIPDAPRVQRDQKQVGPLQRDEDARRIVGPDHGITKPGGQPLEDRRPEQKPPHEG